MNMTTNSRLWEDSKERPVPTKDELWRALERQQSHQLRPRLIKAGTIIPAFAMKPTPLIKVDGKWQVQR